jgi:two-component system alkaline phosphatase synthesis response regulator PhoP
MASGVRADMADGQAVPRMILHRRALSPARVGVTEVFMVDPKTVLVVDDEPHISLSLKYLLRTVNGLNVLTAENGQEALRLAVSARPALILMDIMMPVMNGFDACRAVKALPDYGSEVTIWLVTARGERVDRSRGATVGADDYITKPYDPDAFARRVREHMSALAQKYAPEAV